MIIDISHNNGTIDWNKLKSQVSKVILRVGYGDDISSQDDKQFSRNLSECERLNIPYDFYIYSYAKSVQQARSEASHILRLVSGRKKILYFDSEQPGTESVARQCAEAFRDSIKSAGYQVGLYASESWYNSYLKGITGFDSLWIAKYGANNGKENTKPSIDCDLWQYTSKGHIDGIKGDVDLNVQLKAEPVEKPTSPIKNVTNGIYRLYNNNSGEHFYTKSAKERDNLIKANWNYEGVAWKSPSKGKDVYRIYNSKGFHFFTTSKSERDNLIKNGWKDEGVAWYSDTKKKVPVYRVYNSNSGDHLFTTSKSEKNNLVKSGWKDEGIAFYGI